MDGIIGEELTDFLEMFPHCLPASDLQAKIDGSTASADEIAMMEYLYYVELEMPPVEWMLSYTADDGSIVYDGYYEELDIYVNRYGNLCTNIYEVDMATGRVLTAAHDGIFDMD